MNILKREFEVLKMNDVESVDDYYNRVIVVIIYLKSNGKKFSNVVVMKKFLKSVPSKFEHIVRVIEKRKDLSPMLIEELVGSLQSHKHQMKQRESSTTLE